MSVESRRDFIKSVLLSATTLNMIPTSILTITDTNTNSDLFHELSVINEAWVSHFKISPKTYLESLTSDLWSQTPHLKSLIENEFKTNRTIEIKGLILSQTEAAVLALASDKQSWLS